MTDPRMSAGKAQDRCRNCGQPAGPRFCGNCGQPLDDRRRPLRQILGEILDDWLSFDGRLLSSLGALIRPGRLTLLYLDGKRAPYLRPLRLYLLASLALFSTLFAVRVPDATEVNLYVGDELVSEPAGGSQTGIQVLTPNMVSWLDEHWADKLERFRELPPQQLLDSMVNSMKRYLPAALILFVPFLAAGLKLLYLKSGTLYLDHLIFSLHFQSALFFALAGCMLVTRVLGLGLGPSVLIPFGTAFLILTAYLGRALHRVHPQTWWRTTVRTILLTLIYAFLLRYAFAVAYLAMIWKM